MWITLPFAFIMPFWILYIPETADNVLKGQTEERYLWTRKQQASTVKLLWKKAISQGIAFERAGLAVLVKVFQEVVEIREKPVKCGVTGKVHLLWRFAWTSSLFWVPCEHSPTMLSRIGRPSVCIGPLACRVALQVKVLNSHSWQKTTDIKSHWMSALE